MSGVWDCPLAQASSEVLSSASNALLARQAPALSNLYFRAHVQHGESAPHHRRLPMNRLAQPPVRRSGVLHCRVSEGLSARRGGIRMRAAPDVAPHTAAAGSWLRQVSRPRRSPTSRMVAAAGASMYCMERTAQVTLYAQTLPAAIAAGNGCPCAGPARGRAGGGGRRITAVPAVCAAAAAQQHRCRVSRGARRLHADRVTRVLGRGGRQACARVRHGAVLHPPPLALLAGARVLGTLVGVQRQRRERRARRPQPAQERGCLRGARRATAAVTAGLLGRQEEGRMELLIEVGGLRKNILASAPL